MTMGGCTNKEGREESTNRSPLSRVVSSASGTRGTIGMVPTPPSCDGVEAMWRVLWASCEGLIPTQKRMAASCAATCPRASRTARSNTCAAPQRDARVHEEQKRKEKRGDGGRVARRTRERSGSGARAKDLSSARRSCPRTARGRRLLFGGMVLE